MYLHDDLEKNAFLESHPDHKNDFQEANLKPVFDALQAFGLKPEMRRDEEHSSYAVVFHDSTSAERQIGLALAAQPELNVEIEGHTDGIGSVAYNMKLSQRRADAVKAYLVGKSVDGGHLVAQGYGKSHPIASNDTDEGRAQNRRVEFDVQNAPFDVKVVKQGASAASTEAAEQGPGPKPAKKHHKKQAAPAAADQSATPADAAPAATDAAPASAAPAADATPAPADATPAPAPAPQ